jgi:hypothetical protein
MSLRSAPPIIELSHFLKSWIFQMNRREQIIFQILGLLVAVFGCIAAWLVMPQIQQMFSSPTIADPPTQRSPVADLPTQLPSLRIMDNIYNALRLENLVADKAYYTSGEDVVFSYKLTNVSSQTLVIPENNDYSRSFYLVGTIQTWIERLGSDNNSPSISDETWRNGARYSSGGSIIDVGPDKRVIEPGESIPLEFILRFFLRLTSLHPGMYRVYVDYERLDGSVIQTLSVDIEIR